MAVFLAHLTWFGLLVVEARVDFLMPAIVVMLLVIMNVAGLGAFITALRAPAHRLLLGLTMAPLSAALGTLSNLLFGRVGVRVDFSGFYNDAGLFSMLLAYSAFVAAVGGGIGIWLARRRAAANPPVAELPVVVAATPVVTAEMTATPIAPDDLPQIRSD